MIYYLNRGDTQSLKQLSALVMLPDLPLVEFQQLENAPVHYLPPVKL